MGTEGKSGTLDKLIKARMPASVILKPLKKGKMFQSGREGELDFDHHFAFSTIFLKR